MNLAAEIKQYRKQMGISQKALADNLGVARNTVVRWEMGLINPRADKLRQIQNMAAVFGNKGKEEK